jgi:hypothetical protein
VAFNRAIPYFIKIMIDKKTHEMLSSLTGTVFAAIFPAVWIYWIVTEGLEDEQLMMAVFYLVITLGLIQIPFFIGLLIGSVFWAFFLNE